MAKKKGNNARQVPKTVEVRIHPDVRPDTPFYYVNYVSVSHTPFDFTLSVLRVPSPLTQEQMAFAQDGKPVPVEPVLQVVIPPPVIKALIGALSEQYRKYEAEMGNTISGVRDNEKRKRE